jgi:hypothetical protein
MSEIGLSTSRRYIKVSYSPEISWVCLLVQNFFKLGPVRGSFERHSTL